MIYLKTTFQGKPITVNIYDDEIYSRCSNCGKEFQVDGDRIREFLEEGGDFSSVALSCCKDERPSLSRVK